MTMLLKNKIITRLFLLLSLTIIIAWSFEAGLLRFNYPSRADYPIHGLDISHHQGKIDWDVLKQQDIQFIYMKATEGGDWVDPKFKLFWQSAMERELVIGAYHFYRLCKTGNEQADNFIATVPKSDKSLPHMVDLEYMGNCETAKSKEQIISEVTDYMDKIYHHYGKQTIIYATEEFYNYYLQNQLPQSKIWIRNIFYKPTLTDNREWIIWQYSNRGIIKGIENNVDLNVFYGDKTQFDVFRASGKS